MTASAVSGIDIRLAAVVDCTLLQGVQQRLGDGAVTGAQSPSTNQVANRTVARADAR